MQPVNINLKYRNDVIFVCPYCGNEEQKGAEISWDTRSTTIWSDGKCFPPLSINRSEVIRCSKCTQVYWIKDIVEFEEASKVKFHEENEYVEFPSFGLLYNDIKHLDNEKLAKVKLLQEFNDYKREGKEDLITPEVQKKHENNLLDLSRILDVKNITERILLIEVFRNRGKYQESQSLMEYISIPYLIYLKRRFLKEIASDNRYPIILNPYSGDYLKTPKSG